VEARTGRFPSPLTLSRKRERGVIVALRATPVFDWSGE
jgi:hypothetical protein